MDQQSLESSITQFIATGSVEFDLSGSGTENDLADNHSSNESNDDNPNNDESYLFMDSINVIMLFQNKYESSPLVSFTEPFIDELVPPPKKS